MQIDALKSLNRPLALGDLEPEPRHETIEVGADDRSALTAHYDVHDIALLKGDLEVTRHGSLIRVAGTIEADLGRTCVVSLAPLRERIAEDFAVAYTTDIPDVVEGEIEADLDAPEPLEADVLNLGEVLLEQLVLAMDPHPRAEGAKPPEDPGQTPESSPFDVLKSLKT
ncbi:MAG: DUF177 domain-containing protein [Pseudomonadota bacterium]